MSTNGQLVFTDVDKITFKGVGNTSNAVVDTVTGKIGVGIDNPDANLHVLGNSYVSTNLELGGTLIMGTVNVSAHHSLEAVTAEGNTTPLTVEFSNATTGIVTTGNVEVGGELTASGNVEVGNMKVGLSPKQYQKLVADDGAASDYFGYSVAISGDTMVIGAYKDDSVKGSAYVFTRTNGIWTQRAKLTAGDGAGGDEFGYSVSIDGDTVVIGAPANDDDGTYSGSAYVFTRDTAGDLASGWTQVAKLTADDGAAGDNFGWSVSIDGDTVVIGAVGDNVSTGSAYVFTRNTAGDLTSGWTQRAKLTAGDGAQNDYFGRTVSIDGDTVVIGAYADDDNGASSGSAYVFTRDTAGNLASGWTQRAKLTAGDGVQYDFFGISVSIDGDTAVIGAYLDDDKGGNSGSAYVFTRDTAGDLASGWTQVAKLTAGDGAMNDQFGASVSIDGDTAVIGAWKDDDNGTDSGSAYVFMRDTAGNLASGWTQLTKLTASDGAAGDYFGQSVSIDGDTILIGAYADDDNGASSGSVYTFSTLAIKNITVTGNATVERELTVAGNTTVSSNLTVSGNVEVSADTQVQEYPPRSLHQYSTHVEGHGVFNVLASAEYNQTGDNDRAWKMFTKIADADNYWTPTSDGYDASNGNATSASPSTNNTAGHWVQLELPYKIKLHSVKIASSANHADRRAKDATVFGSNDGGSTWTNVGGWTDNNVSDFSLVTFSMNNVGYYNLYRLVVTKNGGNATITLTELQFFGTPAPTTLDKDSLSLSRSLDVPRVSRYDVDTETPRPEKLVVDFDTTVNSTPTDISGKGNHGAFKSSASYFATEKAFNFTGWSGDTPAGSQDWIQATATGTSGNFIHSVSMWVKSRIPSTSTTSRSPFHMGNAAVANQEMQIQFNYTDNTVYLGTQGGWLTMSNMEDIIKQDQWHHIAYTYNGTNMLPANTKFYIDGNQMTMGSGSSSQLNFPSETEDIFLGRFDNPTNANWWNGQISNFKLYNVALEASEVRKLYRLGRTGRSMVISDTAVGIGKAPEAQLDVRGNMTVRGDVNIPSGRFTIHRFMGSGTGTFGGSGNITLPFELDYGPNNPAVGWEIRLSFGASGTNYGMCSISGCYDSASQLIGVSEAFSLQLRTTDSNWSNKNTQCFLSRRETVAPAYQAIIRIVNPLAENIPSGSSIRWHFSYECTGCYASTGVTTIRGGGYFILGTADRRIKHLIVNSATGSISGHYNFVAIS